MSAHLDDPISNAELGAAIAAYILARERGEAPSREALLAAHPAVAAELASFLDDHEQMRELAVDPTLPLRDAPAVGTHLRYVGDYELEAEIARGGMGVVYRALQRSLQRPVAVKMILAGAHAQEDEVARFRAEAEAAASLQHPGIVPIYEIGEHERRPYFSMALVEGQDLGRMLRECPLPSGRAAQIAADVADAIAHAHGKGIVHRDLKPSNVIVDAQDRPHVTDFGLAKRIHAVHAMTATGQVLGTPSYMAPEQAAGRRDVGPAADVYALGALLYEMLTGRAPYRADSPLETLRQVLDPSIEPPSPRALNDAVPRDLETIVQKCLRMEPGDRYASASELAADLRRHLDGKPVLARPVGAAGRLARWCRRNPAMSGLVAACALLLVAVAATSSAGYVRVKESLARESALAAEAVKQRGAAEEQAIRARRASYGAQMLLARQAWEEGDMARMQHLLDGNQGATDLASFELGYLRGLPSSGSTPLVPQGVRRTMRVQAIHPVPGEPGLVVVARVDGASVWDLATRAVVRDMRPGRPSLLLGSAVSPDGALLATGERHGALRLWDLRTGEERRTLVEGDPIPGRRPGDPPADPLAAARAPRPPSVSAVAFSPDGELLVAAIQGTSMEQPGALVGWEVATGRELWRTRGTRYHTSALQVSPDGTTVAAADATVGSLHFWRSADGAVLHEAERVAEGGTSSIAFSADGRTLAVALVDSELETGGVLLWDVAARREGRTIGTGGSCFGVAWSRDGRCIAAATGTGASWVSVADVATGRVEQRLRGHVGPVLAVAYLDDGRLVSGADDGSLRLWDAHGQQERRVVGGRLPGPAPDAVVLPGGEIVLAVNDFTSGAGAVMVFGPDGAELRRAYRELDLFVTTIDASRDGARVAVGGSAQDGPASGTLRVLDARTLQHPSRVDGLDRSVDTLAFSPSGKLLAAATVQDPHLHVLDAASLAALHPPTPVPEGRGLLAFPADDTAVVVGWKRGEEAIAGRSMPVRAPVLLSVDVASGKVRAEASLDIAVQTLASSPDGRTIAVGGDGVRLHATADLAETGRIEGLGAPGDGKQGGATYALTFTPDGRRLATAGREPAIRIWDVATREEVLTLRGGTLDVADLAFAPDGNGLVATTGRPGGGLDGDAWLWSASPAAP